MKYLPSARRPVRPARLPALPALFIAVALLVHPAAGLAQPVFESAERSARDSDTRTVRLAAWNMENFFDRHDNPYTDDDGTPPKPAAELQQLADLIQQADADVLGVSEVETAGVLDELLDREIGPGAYPYVMVGSRDFARGINNGLASRFPIAGMTVHRWHKPIGEGEPYPPPHFSRDVLRFDVRLPNERILEVFVLHLKSKRDGPGDPDSARRRLAEAERVRQIVQKRLANDPDRLLAVIGDFNDTPDSEPMRTLLADDLLIDVHAALDSTAVTYLNEPYRSRIDYILASPALAERATRAWTLEAPDASDHAMVLAEFAFDRADARD